MSALGVMFIAMGIADLCGRRFRAGWLPAVVGPVAVVVLAALSALWHLGDIVPLVIAAVATLGWVLLCRRAERSGRHQIPPLVLLGAATVLLIVLSGWASPVGGVVAYWTEWVALPLDNVSPTKVVMAVGVMVLQLVTGNQLVRLVLASVGALRPAGEPQPSDRLKGGRLLGPMERVLILGLGLGGQLALVTVVVAAKSIIRFPEITAQRERKNGDVDSAVGIDDVVEYFLVGSFTSWLLAFSGLALVLAQ